MAGDAYVTNQTWVRTVGRPDAIDEIADQFERPDPRQSALSAADEPGRGAGWPQHSRGWRSAVRLHPALRETA